MSEHATHDRWCLVQALSYVHFRYEVKMPASDVCFVGGSPPHANGEEGLPVKPSLALTAGKDWPKPPILAILSFF